MQSLGKKVYLCGPINGCTDEEAKDWRTYCAEKLNGTCFDPMVRDYRGRELDPGIAAEIVENDKSDILQCDSLLVYYEKPSVGTSMEVLFAYDNGIPAVVVDKSGKPLSPWFVYHSSAVFPSLDAAVSFLNKGAA